MQSLRVNGYDMAYLEVGQGPALICVHGTLGDFRTWYPVLGPLSKSHRVISISLRRFFPEHWNGIGEDYRTAQHVSELIGFIEQTSRVPIDLMGHSRGGRLAFSVAATRPELLRKLVLAEPGGELDSSLEPAAGEAREPGRASRIAISADKVRAGDIEGGLKHFFDGIEGDGAWARLPAAAKQQLRDNAFTLLGQVNENRKPYTLADAQSIRTPTLPIGGSATRGSLSVIWRVLAQHISGAKTVVIPDASHWMFDQAPQEYCTAVTEFLAA